MVDTLTEYEKLLEVAYQEGVIVKEIIFNSNADGLYMDNKIAINKNLDSIDKACVLAEELGHHYTTHGNILDQNDINNRKQERTARKYAYTKLLPLEKLAMTVFDNDISSIYDLADKLELSISFVESVLCSTTPTIRGNSEPQGFILFIGGL